MALGCRGSAWWLLTGQLLLDLLDPPEAGVEATGLEEFGMRPLLHHTPFVEDDHRPTRLPFDSGRVPLYIAVVWVVFISVYVVVMAMLALPDLRAWW